MRNDFERQVRGQCLTRVSREVAREVGRSHQKADHRWACERRAQARCAGRRGCARRQAIRALAQRPSMGAGGRGYHPDRWPGADAGYSVSWAVFLGWSFPGVLA